jgi:hypothetical protein
MPPCIIMEKGESLDVWIAKPGTDLDFFTGLQVHVPFLDMPFCFGIKNAWVACEASSWFVTKHALSEL